MSSSASRALQEQSSQPLVGLLSDLCRKIEDTFPGSIEDVDLNGDPGCAWIAATVASWAFVIEAYHDAGLVTLRGVYQDGPRMLFNEHNAEGGVFSFLLRLSHHSGFAPLMVVGEPATSEPAELAPMAAVVPKKKSLRGALTAVCTLAVLAAFPTAEGIVLHYDTFLRFLTA